MKHLFIILAITLSIINASCDMMGDLDQMKPENVLTDETLITDEMSAETAINGVYATWRTIEIGWFTHLMSMRTGTEQMRYIGGYQGFPENDVKIENIGVQKNYTALYRVINMANSVISQLDGKIIEGLSDQRTTEILAEAKFHRAMAHFHLLREFGEFWDKTSEYGMVTYEETVRGDFPKARNTVQNTYQIILNDLNEVVKMAPEMPKAHYYISQLTGKALLAKIHLYMNDFEQAAILAQEVINDGPALGYNLETVYFDVFENAFYSPEVLFALHASYPNEPTSIYGSTLRPGGTLTSIADQMVDGDGIYDKRYVDAYLNARNKYVQEDFASNEPANTQFFLRMAEMYYIVAEAQTRLGEPESARVALATITERAGYSQTDIDAIADDMLLDQILKHKWMELNTENNEEWFDLVRYHILDNYVIAPDFVMSDKHLLLPIPRAAMAGNNLLKQNKGY
ncbi:RagB/SusD family nutrient uptake outer membrane protein [Carboxylicivirga sp. N1Y90]|uniref:RagB/SusD family nutrient uptake outer membrane protein n=1 Tax=Carboxylicivirga fragile TaxID=3417571 RepID=UPI003D3543CD|nr:RagB/SusD family nutrient uptake outer membrane protein [Marinilabiliaceae bacterium N1Y90]